MRLARFNNSALQSFGLALPKARQTSPDWAEDACVFESRESHHLGPDALHHGEGAARILLGVEEAFMPGMTGMTGM